MAHSAVRTDATSPLSYQPSWVEPSLFLAMDGDGGVWQVDPPESPRGGYWTLNTSGCHNAAVASLSSVLATPDSILPKYYLSSTACQGILRRAAKRGKALPPILEQALQSRASQQDSASATLLDTSAT